MALASLGSAALASCAEDNSNAPSDEARSGGGAAESGSSDDASSGADDSQGATPTVYIARDVSSASLVRAYQALGFTPQGRVAVKLSTGETGSNYLRPELIADLVHDLDELGDGRPG